MDIRSASVGECSPSMTRFPFMDLPAAKQARAHMHGACMGREKVLAGKPANDET